MKRKILCFFIINIVFVIILTLATNYCTKLKTEMTLTLYLGESHAGHKTIAQLFYSDDVESLKKNSPLTVNFEDDVIQFSIGTIDLRKNIIRIDPFNQMEDFSIKQMTVSFGEKTVVSLTGKEFSEYTQKKKAVSSNIEGDVLVCEAKSSDPRLIMSKAFSKKLYRYYFIVNVLPYILIVLLYLVVGIVEVRMLKTLTAPKWIVIIGVILSGIVLCAGGIAKYAFSYFEKHLGQVPFSQLVYHLHTPLVGTDTSSYRNVIIIGIITAILPVIIFYVIYDILKKENMHVGFLVWGFFGGLMLLSYSGVRTFLHFDIAGYYEYTHSGTTLYEDRYADGKEVAITFPEKKRNLIYIFLESMEITYADTESGGAMQNNYIPNLTALALENNCFSEGTVINGAYHVLGATYTMGALAAQTSGVPINNTFVSVETLNDTWESENNYLPGVWSIGDILNEEGYNQEFLLGSNAGFAGRSSYFKGHGSYDIEDYNAAIEAGRIPADYNVWWGYEDEKLFAFAKEDVLKLAGQDAPFNFTMLTADTHFTDGYYCELCDDDYESQYSNVIACSDRQVVEFVNWIKRQDFYDNTTIIVAGDHLTMDSYYIVNEGAEGYDRRAYFTVINPVADKVNVKKQRAYTIMDLFPTTLSAMGVNIEGNRLGLGVDLYSDTPTLAEEYGMGYLNTELMKNSDYYTKKLLYK